MSEAHLHRVDDAVKETDSHDQRAHPRFALLLRGAKLIGPSGEFLCIIRDISGTGARLRLFHPIVDVTGLSLEIVPGQRFDVEKVWVNDDEAGFHFADAIDVKLFVNGKAALPKRSVRLLVSHPATLSYSGYTNAATIHDLSREGARISTPERLAITQTVRLESDHLPPVEASVRWRRHPDYGLAFHQVMSMQELALRVHKIQLSRLGKP